MSVLAGVPIYVNVRDRLHDLRLLIAWLEKAGCDRITLLDNASTYGPLVDFLRATPHDVVCLGRNFGSRALWRAGLVPDEAFIYTDPDVVPLPACPPDAVAHLHELLDRHPDYPKAGLGLYLGDVPSDLQCLEWESGDRINGPVVGAGVRDSLVDTTFALYRPGVPFTLTALRTEWPYVARHSSWYDADTVDEQVERAYYLEHAVGGSEGSSWKDGLQR